MSKAEEAALKAYPEHFLERITTDVYKDARKYYQEGYEQAEKDIAANDSVLSISGVGFFSDGETIIAKMSVNEALQAKYEKGREDAIKELALTWEDVEMIVKIADSMLTGTAWDSVEWPEPQKYYEEVLRRFNDGRNGKT